MSILSGSNFIDLRIRASLAIEAQEDLLASIVNSSSFPRLNALEIESRLSKYAFSGARNREVIVSEIVSPLLEEILTSSRIVRKKVFDSFRAYDAYSVQSGKKYHYLHQFDVFLLGLSIMCTIWDQLEAKKNYFGYEDPVHMFHAWVLTSIVHDFGYPLESLEDRIKDLAKIFGDLGARAVSSKLKASYLKKVIKSSIGVDIRALHNIKIRIPDGTTTIGDLLRLCIQDTIRVGEHVARKEQEKMVSVRDHGYMSAVILSAFMSSIGNYFVSDPKKYDVIVKALGAIALHVRGKSLIRKMTLRNNPFAHLLLICDNLQDWDRSFFHQENYPTCCLTKYRASKDSVGITYFFYHKKWQSNVRSELVNYLRKKVSILRALERSKMLGVNLSISMEDNCGKIDYKQVHPTTFQL